MKFKIHFEHASGLEDSFVVEGENIKEIQDKSDVELKRRCGGKPWSEKLADGWD